MTKGGLMAEVKNCPSCGGRYEVVGKGKCPYCAATKKAAKKAEVKEETESASGGRNL